ncbi:hypothetical protein EDB83DRAFT_2313987 [Lactarius deliciosus]|nr:hypothetical protein EDB83DRAFT_2313987 [Lactarius deliciosus]
MTPKIGPLTWSGSAPVVPSLEVTFMEGNGNPTMQRGVREGVRPGFSADSISASRSCSLGSGSVNHAGGIDDVRDEARKERVARDKALKSVSQFGSMSAARILPWPVPSLSPEQGQTHRRDPRQRRDGEVVLGAREGGGHRSG